MTIHRLLTIHINRSCYST